MSSIARLPLTACLLLAAASPLSAQDGGVAGRVVSARSFRPLEGALIIVNDTGPRARTDADGRFLFSNLVGAHVALAVQKAGYRPLTQTVRVGEQAVRLVLTETAVELDAIVVTGTPGETEARAIGNAVGTVAVPQVLEAAPVVDVQQLLNARVPGIVIMPYQGNVGTGARTRVRGVSSLTIPNEPLIYIDGIRVDNNPRAGPDIRNRRQIARINDINPEDIERIEILKGPAAAALYGTEASHGVIQILTRQGTEGPLRLGVTVKQGANWFMDPAGRLPTVYARDPSTGELLSLNLYRQEQDAGRPMFQTGGVQSYGITASGGTPGARYYLSTALDRDEGIVWYNWRRRIAARANVSLVPNDRIGVQASLGVVHNKVRLGAPAQSWDLMTQIVWGSPLYTKRRGFRVATPEDAATIESWSETARFIGGVRLRHQPWSWLSQHLTIGADVGDETSSQLFPRHPDGDQGPFGGLSKGQLTVDRWRVTYTTFDYLAAASFDVAPRLAAVTSFGAQYYAKRIHTVQAVGSDFPLGVRAIAGAANTEATEDVAENKTVGVYGQQQLGWQNRLFLTAAVRADDNSAFGTNFDFATYPKVGLSWVLSEEPFWASRLVNAFKLRAAWGRAGQQPDAYAALRSYQPVTGPGDISVLTPQNVGNPDMAPERGEELEFGFDAGLWDDRVSIAFTHFRQRTTNALAPRVVSPSTGFSGTQFVNIGLTRNRGIEVALNAGIVEGPKVTWDVGFTFSTNENQVVSLGGLPPIALAAVNAGIPAYDAQFHQEGFPLAAYFLPKVSVAWFDSAGDLQMMCAGGQDLGREDPTQLVACNSSVPRVYAGQPTPTWEGALRTGVTLFRNLRLYGLVDFRGGHVMTNLDAGLAHRMERNTLAINDSSDAELLAYDYLARFTQTGANRRMGFMKAGFAKLREVSATYTLPPAWATRFGLSHAAITIAGRNLAILWRAQKDIYGVQIIDPEVGFPEDLNGRVQNTLPQYAQFVTAVRLTF